MSEQSIMDQMTKIAGRIAANAKRLPGLIAKEQQERLSEIDRNARAYGWEIGNGHALVERIEDCSPDNPFLDPTWREQAAL